MKLDLPDIQALNTALNGPEGGFPAIADQLCGLDEQGLLIAPQESPEEFQKRLTAMHAEWDYEPPADARPLPGGIREEAERTVFGLYGASPRWIPVYCSSVEAGRFSARVTLILEKIVSIVFLSGAFLNKSRHRGYDAAETLAHEMVHALRIAYPVSAYEEYFPCQVHKSRFRRLAGNLFRRWEIPVLFFCGLMFATLHPVFLLIPLAVLLREIQLHLRIRSAAKKLRELHLRRNPFCSACPTTRSKRWRKEKHPRFWRIQARSGGLCCSGVSRSPDNGSQGNRRLSNSSRMIPAVRGRFTGSGSAIQPSR